MSYLPAIGLKLKRVLLVVFTLFALLAVNGIYLGSITLLEWMTGNSYQDQFYLLMFLFHLVVGLLIIIPIIVFGAIHIKNAWSRPNKRAIYAGMALFITALILLISGLALTRFEFFEIINPDIRNYSYWIHLVTPILIAWLFILHRLAGPAINWKQGTYWAIFTASSVLLMIVVYAQDPRQWDVVGPKTGEKYFFPSLARTETGNFIPAKKLMMQNYCMQCHADVGKGWEHSAHRFASFNNPAYLFSVRETRKDMLERDGNVQGSRFCAGCHDPVPFFSGAFDDPDFDDIGHPTANAGITCVSCHAINHLNSNRGNADFTISEPLHYPFTFSENKFLQSINRQLIKAKPEFHKNTFLKPFHKKAEFCAACHKVHLPVELNDYKWLRGQNHYDSFLLSGVSGHGITSFYYPKKAKENCAVCHMPLEVSNNDFGAKLFDDSGELKIHNHLFPAANTGLAHLLSLPAWVNKSHEEFLKDSLRIDIFGIKDGGTISSRLIAPLRPEIPSLQPGHTYLLETVIRTLTLGHLFTQGTADSNEVWVDVEMTSGNEIIARSGGKNHIGEVDPWSHFINVYMLDRHGNRIDRRNAHDIFVPLYDNQIPPGASDVIHYLFKVPENVNTSLTVNVKLLYRKFDTTYIKKIQGDSFTKNDLPIVTIASDSITFPVGSTRPTMAVTEPDIPLWQRWNDYGIALIRKGDKGSNKGELRQAEQAFKMVEDLGKPDGALNQARVYIKEGRLDDASAALIRAIENDEPANKWSIAWFSGIVNKQNGFLDEAIKNYYDIIDTNFIDARKRGFDFSKDYRVLNELGQTLFERSRQERGEMDRDSRKKFLNEARDMFNKALKIDPENVVAHYNLSLIYSRLNNDNLEKIHRSAYLKYKPDDNAMDRAINIHRLKNPAANHAAQPIVIYDLQRTGAYGMKEGISHMADLVRNTKNAE